MEKLRLHLDASGFDDVEITRHGSTKPAKTDPNDPFVLLVNEAARDAYGREPVVSPIIGGSGPSYPFCTRTEATCCRRPELVTRARALTPPTSIFALLTSSWVRGTLPTSSKPWAR